MVNEMKIAKRIQLFIRKGNHPDFNTQIVEMTLRFSDVLGLEE
jgi:hypothetical protein